METEGPPGPPVPDDASDLDDLRWQVLREEAQQARRRPGPRPVRFGTGYREPDGRLSLRLRGFAVGVVVVVGCILLALLANAFGPPGRPLRNPSPVEAPGLVGGLLPDGQVLVGGERRDTADLRPAVLIISGQQCGSCRAQVDAAAARVSTLEVPILNLGPGGPVVGVTALEDPDGVLAPLATARTRTYLVAADGTILHMDEAPESSLPAPDGAFG